MHNIENFVYGVYLFKDFCYNTSEKRDGVYETYS